MHTVQFLTRLVEHQQTLAYAVICVGLVFEGEFILLATGILAHLGALNIWYALIFIFLGVTGKTFLGYYLGRMLHDKWHHTKVMKHITRQVRRFAPHFDKNPFWSIFVSKFIIGINNMIM